MSIKNDYKTIAATVPKKTRPTPEEIGLAVPKTLERTTATRLDRPLVTAREFAGDIDYCHGNHDWSAIRDGHYRAGSFTPYCKKCGVRGNTTLLRNVK